MTVDDDSPQPKSEALTLLASERPRNVSWFGAAGMLFGDWGTSRLYVLGLAFLVAGRASFWLIVAMSSLILFVGWAYTQICRLYPDGGGVYTAGKRKHKLLGVVGALLLFADYTVTASLSAVEAFHYFGLGAKTAAVAMAEDAGGEIILPKTSSGGDEQSVTLAELPADVVWPRIAGSQIRYENQSLIWTGNMNADQRDELLATSTDAKYRQAIEQLYAKSHQEGLWHLNSPGLWAIIAIIAIGFFNLLGPKHSSGFAVAAAIGMVIITVGVVGFALPQIDWSKMGEYISRPVGEPLEIWEAFVFIVLALSGVEAIANLTGVMKKPVYKTSRKSIWFVACEVALFNLLLTLVMVSIYPLSREGHKEDMMAFMASYYIGPWGEWPVRIIAGTLLLSATNTAVNGLMSIIYVMSRDGEMPSIFQKLNGFGAPWVAAALAATVPAVVLIFAHDLQTLAALYAIGVVGAVALNTIIATSHPRLRHWWRKAGMGLLAAILLCILVTLAFTKIPALIFVLVVSGVGFTLRAITKAAAKRRQRPTLLRRAIADQLTPESMSKKRILVATAGSATNAEAAINLAAAEDAALVVAFVRDVALNYKVDASERFSLDTDPAAEDLFTDFLALGHKMNVPIIPAYDTGSNSTELIAEIAALNAVDRVLIGSSRRGALHQIIKGSFQRKLESLLPPEIPVQVLSAKEG